MDPITVITVSADVLVPDSDYIWYSEYNTQKRTCVCAQLKRNYISTHRGAAKTIPCLVIRTYRVLKALECGLEFSNRSEILDSDWNDAKMLLFPLHTPWEGYLPVKSIGGLPLKGPIMRSFDVFPVVISSKVLIKQLSCQWFSIPWRSRDVTVI